MSIVDNVRAELDNYDAIGDKMYAFYKHSSSGDYMIERIKSRFYGNMASDHIKYFNELYEILKAGGHGPKNPLLTGDADEGSWIEKGPDEYTRVIAIERYCSYADDNTHIFILNQVTDDWTKFLGVTAYPEEEKSGNTWGDHRDYKQPSIQTFRDHKFDFGYSDGRDKHYCFKYNSVSGNVEDAHWNERRLTWALGSLSDCLECIKLEQE